MNSEVIQGLVSFSNAIRSTTMVMVAGVASILVVSVLCYRPEQGPQKSEEPSQKGSSFRASEDAMSMIGPRTRSSLSP